MSREIGCPVASVNWDKSASSNGEAPSEDASGLSDAIGQGWTGSGAAIDKVTGLLSNAIQTNWAQNDAIISDIVQMKSLIGVWLAIAGQLPVFRTDRKTIVLFRSTLAFLEEITRFQRYAETNGDNAGHPKANFLRAFHVIWIICRIWHDIWGSRSLVIPCLTWRSRSDSITNAKWSATFNDNSVLTTCESVLSFDCFCETYMSKLSIIVRFFLLDALGDRTMSGSVRVQKPCGCAASRLSHPV
jgi:hypothetical protein